MRLQASFLLLLLIASTATSIIWKDFGSARDGDAVARAVVFSVTPVALVSVVLLGRIILAVGALRRRAKE